LEAVLYQALPSNSQAFVPDLKVGIEQPDLGESKVLVWKQLQANPVHLPSSLHIFCLQLFKESIIDPQVDVATPE
jgi:hypothetical protein